MLEDIQIFQQMSNKWGGYGYTVTTLKVCVVMGLFCVLAVVANLTSSTYGVELHAQAHMGNMNKVGRWYQ